MGIKITALEGNRQKLDGGAMFGHVPKPLWSSWLEPDSNNRVELACRSMLIEIGDDLILCETGIGAFFAPKMAERYGVQKSGSHVLLENLEKMGIKQDQITHIVLSHLHFDHAGGLLPKYDSIQAGDDELLFPNAKIIVGQEALDRCLNPHPRDQASFVPLLQEKLLACPRLQVVDGEKLEGFHEQRISFFYSHGHTPGQMHLRLDGDRETIVFCGDLVPGLAWVHLPVTMGYDRFPERLIEEKQELYDQAVSGKWRLFFTHDPKVSTCLVNKNENNRYLPIQTELVFDRIEI